MVKNRFYSYSLVAAVIACLSCSMIFASSSELTLDGMRFDSYAEITIQAVDLYDHAIPTVARDDLAVPEVSHTVDVSLVRAKTLPVRTYDLYRSHRVPWPIHS